MDSKSTDGRSQTRNCTPGFEPTRRAVLAAGGTVSLGAIAGCTDLDGLVARASDQVVGTTAASPAAFYPGRESGFGSDSDTTASGSDTDSSTVDTSRPHIVRSGEPTVRSVPPTITYQGRITEAEGWSVSSATTAQDYNSSRSNKPSTVWWGDPDEDEDEEDEDDEGILVNIQDVELLLLGHVAIARDAVGRRDQADAKQALDAFIDVTTNALGPELDRCGSEVCEMVRAHSDVRKQGVRTAREAVDAGNWNEAAKELQAVDEIVLGDLERLDDELQARRPGRPRVIDMVRYLRAEPTIGERFTVCLPDAKLPGDLGSLAEELTPGRVLSYFAASDDPDGVRTPFGDRYGSQGLAYDEEGCIQLDGAVALHRDISCGTILTADLDTYRTANRGIVGYSTDGGAVASGAVRRSARTGRNPQTGKEIQRSEDDVDTDGTCVFVAADGTLYEPESLNSWGTERTASGVSVSQTLVCPVNVTPADCPCPLPGLFYVRRCLHDEQVIFAGGWVLDEGALYEDSVTLLFDEGPTEIASVSPEDIESDAYDDRIVDQFSRERSQHGSAIVSAQVQGTDMNNAELIEEMASQAFQTEQGRNGLNAVNVKVVGQQGDNDSGNPLYTSVTALDAPLVHLADASGTGNDVKFKAGAELSKSVN